MGYQKKAQKWAAAVGLPSDPCFWVAGDSAPLKEFFAKLLSSEILRKAPDVAVSDPIPFEKLLSIAQHKLGIHTCLVGSDLAGNEANLKLGLFGTVIFLKSALADYKSEILAQIPPPDFGIAGGLYSNKPTCLKCNKEVMFIERIVVAEKTWHRSCMHCAICGKRLLPGLFRITAGNRLECFEHLINHTLCGNELMPFENFKPTKAPPPRPPPPKKIQTSPTIQQPKEDGRLSAANESSPESKPLPSPRSLAGDNKPKEGNGGSDHSGEGTWEMLHYPEKLNPFADEDGDDLSDNISCLNPFGESSSDSESDVEHVEHHTTPVPAPRKSNPTPQPAERASIQTKEELEEKKSDSLLAEADKKEEETAESLKCAEPLKSVYPELKNLFLDEDCESFNYYMPASLVLCKKRHIDLNEFDKIKLVHEYQKVIKTLDFIERSAKEAERTLLKEISKEGFKWDKNPLVDAFGQFMQQKHDNLLKGSMIVHAYMRKLLASAVEQIDKIGDASAHATLRAQLLNLDVKLKSEDRTVAIPSVMEDPPPKVREAAKKKSLAKRIKKVF